MNRDKDFLEFKSTMKEVSDNLSYDCGFPVEEIFNDVVSDVGNLLFSRNKKIADLEKKLKKSPKKEVTPLKQNEPDEKPKKECPPGKIINPKTGRCINKPKEKTQKKPQKDKSKKECPPGKIVNPKTGRCINKPKEKTNKKSGKSNNPEIQLPPEPDKSISLSESFNKALEHIRTTGKPGSYRALMNDIKRKFGITLKYDNHGDDYAAPDLYFMKGKKECSREEMKEVMKYVVDTAEKSKSPPSQRKTESMTFANGKTINLDLGVA
tara:strand:+ start:106 stop:903 length:798 start_codon:yes stop_codon:yes gene_type:complete